MAFAFRLSAFEYKSSVLVQDSIRLTGFDTRYLLYVPCTTPESVWLIAYCVDTKFPLQDYH